MNEKSQCIKRLRKNNIKQLNFSSSSSLNVNKEIVAKALT